MGAEKGVAMNTNKEIFSQEEILSILPHRPPFLFVDSIVAFVPDKRIVALRSIRAGEPYFKGHFPQKAIMPGVLVTDALAQTSGLLWGFSKKARGEDTGDDPEIFYLASASMKYTTPAYPGETLRLSSEHESQFGQLYSYRVEATVNRNVIAKGKLTLAMVRGNL
jgi:3-hydroxyacyl-[acyl-carrier-protein] dehydratase